MKYSPVKFDHERNVVTIGKKGNKAVLKGVCVEGKLSMISSTSMGKLLKKGQIVMAHLFMISTTDQYEETIVEKPPQELIERYSDLFKEPKTLPSTQDLDHIILL